MPGTAGGAYNAPLDALTALERGRKDAKGKEVGQGIRREKRNQKGRGERWKGKRRGGRGREGIGPPDSQCQGCNHSVKNEGESPCGGLSHCGCAAGIDNMHWSHSNSISALQKIQEKDQ